MRFTRIYQHRPLATCLKLRRERAGVGLPLLKYAQNYSHKVSFFSAVRYDPTHDSEQKVLKVNSAGFIKWILHKFFPNVAVATARAGLTLLFAGLVRRCELIRRVRTA